jgi:hypothetical protein
MMELCLSYHGLAVFFNKESNTFTMAEYDCCLFIFPFQIWPTGKTTGQDLSNFTSDIPDKWLQNKTN